MGNLLFTSSGSAVSGVVRKSPGFLAFLMDFYLIFDGFLVDFRPPKPLKIVPKSIKKSTQQAQVRLPGPAECATRLNKRKRESESESKGTSESKK